ncbi:Na+/H+ antiporter NhaC [Cloacibacillus sp. An23]|uniref:Na+/H+ antiporter NhaC n=1 Tax=Cloacibacillus sp. An23 TaxID=1965591 RepID=UPI000B38652F|nr:Na+/H+ antiporter NhaC [Cloacibacillus sp. An23]OUO93262.1 Na+/H+ antiporter NhaC [Cloacibacillus sp. An23]
MENNAVKASKKLRRPTLSEAITPLLVMFVLLLVGRGIYGLDINPLLLISAAVASVIAYKVGLNWDDMINGVSEKIAKALPAILILVVVGAVVGSWMLSGTIPMLIYYGIEIVSPRYFYVTAFIACMILSTSTGTSWGSVATIGVVLIVIAESLQIPLPVAAASIVGGSYFGDKMSPLSDTTNLAPLAAGAQLFDHIRHMFYTTVPATLFALVVYYFMGLGITVDQQTTSATITAMKNNLDMIFNFNIFVLLPVVIIIAGSVTQKPTIPVMMLSSFVACLLAYFYQGFSLVHVFSGIVGGFTSDMIVDKGIDVGILVPEVQGLINRGGMMSMMETILLVLCAFSFAGIISKAGCLDVILTKLQEFVKGRRGLITSTMASTILMAIATGSDFLTIMIPGELFADTYKKMGFAARNLSRTLEDCGTCVVALIPWSAAGAYCSGVLGVATLDYLPYCFFGFASVTMAFICAMTGFGVMTLDQEKALQNKRRK